jgi:hypothetical protein
VFEDKGKQFQINDNSGCVIERSPFTTFSLKKYEVKIHKDKDDDDICLILWMQRSISLLCSISFHFDNLIQGINEIVVHDIKNG